MDAVIQILLHQRSIRALKRSEVIFTPAGLGDNVFREIYRAAPSTCAEECHTEAKLRTS